MQKRKHSFSLSISPSNLVFSTYRHFPYTLDEAIAELIDNSTQSFADHKRLLGKQLHVEISYKKGPLGSTIVVVDDAFGMDESTLRRALRLAEPPPNRLGRCEFGMGLKTSCCWLGDRWTIRTKQAGHRYEYCVLFDVDSISSSLSKTIRVQRIPKNVEDHFTIITVESLNRDYHTRTIAKAKQRLAQAYQRDISEGRLLLTFNGEKLMPTARSLLHEDGKQVRVSFTFKVGPHRVKGWVGLLGPGAGSAVAGFDIFRRGRLIVPNHKFVGPGLYPEVTTNIIHQRLVGEIDLDTVPVVHLKNGIDLRNFREDFESKLAAAIRDMRGRAIALRYVEADRQPVSSIASCREDALDGTITSADFERESARPVTVEVVTDVSRNNVPRGYLARTLLGLRCLVYLVDSSAAARYVSYERNGDELKVFVNLRHPCFEQLDDLSFESMVEEALCDAASQACSGSTDYDWLNLKDTARRELRTMVPSATETQASGGEIDKMVKEVS